MCKVNITQANTELQILRLSDVLASPLNSSASQLCVSDQMSEGSSCCEQRK